MLPRNWLASRTALVYITAGALLDVWVGVYYWYLTNNPPATDLPWYFVYALLFTGVVLLAIGLMVGQIGRAAREAEVPEKAIPNNSNTPQLLMQQAAPVAPVAAVAPPALVQPTALPPGAQPGVVLQRTQ